MVSFGPMRKRRTVGACTAKVSRTLERIGEPRGSGRSLSVHECLARGGGGRAPPKLSREPVKQTP